MTAKEEKVDEARRCFLRQATTVVGSIGLAASAIPFVSYWLPSLDTEAAAGPVKIDLSQLKPAEQVTVAWQGKPVWVIRRTQEMLDNLPKLDHELLDPNSVDPQQPAYAKNSYRSIKPEYFVAIGVCTHLGCIPNYRPDIGGISPDWLGGFYCPCHGSKYDLAGRVYKNVPAPLNLAIPDYVYVDDKTVMVGMDKV
jgi:ubiquinol-cytochrome c reductase iron-sulfur subunit